MAALMRSIIASTPDLTEEKVAIEVGVTQGQVSHWTGGRLPVPARRAAKLAQALGIHEPAQISIAYREIAPRHSARPSAIKETASPVYGAVVDTTLLTRALEIAMTQFHAQGWMPATRQIAAAASFIYQHVHQGQSWKLAEKTVGDLLAKHGAGAFVQTR